MVSESASSVTISSTLPLDNPGNHDHNTGGAPTVIYEVTAVDTTPVVKVYVKSTASGTWRQWTSWQQAVDTTTRTQRTPGTSITLVAGDQIIVPAAGFYATRLDLQSGTSATTVARTSEEWGIADLLQVLANSASALDISIVKDNGDEYSILDAVVSGTGTSLALLAANASYANCIVGGEIHLGAGAAATELYIWDGVKFLLGDSTAPIPMSTDGTAGPSVIRFQFPMKAGAVNRAITAVFADSVLAGATLKYILTTS